MLKTPRAVKVYVCTRTTVQNGVITGQHSKIYLKPAQVKAYRTRSLKKDAVWAGWYQQNHPQKQIEYIYDLYVLGPNGIEEFPNG